MRLLWISNSPDRNSGYGSQTRQVGRRIAKAGHDIVFAANDGTRAGTWEGHQVLGHGSGDRFSRDIAAEHAARSRADWTVILYDAWVYTHGIADPFEGNPRVAVWAPVDHYPAPPSILPFLSGHTAVAMSAYGRDRLEEAALAFPKPDGSPAFPVWFAPHAVDAVFRPTAALPSTGQPFRRMIGVPAEAQLVGIVAANIGGMTYDRKGWGDMAAALAAHMCEHPDAHVYIHAQQNTHDGIDLPVLLQVTGVPADRIRWADQYVLKQGSVTDGDMAAIYSSLDVLLGTSRGEGFGLPHIEAQACGTPVILSNWTASAELVGDVWSADRPGYQRHPSGWLVPVDIDYDPRQAAFWGKPHIPAIIAALAESHARRGGPAMRDAAIAKASGWAADAVFRDHWRPILDRMASVLAPQVQRPNREQRRRGRAA